MGFRQASLRGYTLLQRVDPLSQRFRDARGAVPCAISCPDTLGGYPLAVLLPALGILAAATCQSRIPGGAIAGVGTVYESRQLQKIDSVDKAGHIGPDRGALSSAPPMLYLALVQPGNVHRKKRNMVGFVEIVWVHWLKYCCSCLMSLGLF